MKKFQIKMFTGETETIQAEDVKGAIKVAKDRLEPWMEEDDYARAYPNYDGTCTVFVICDGERTDEAVLISELAA